MDRPNGSIMATELLLPPITCAGMARVSRAGGAGSVAGDEAIYLAVVEQPAPVLLDHLVRVCTAGADDGAVRAVLDQRPVGGDLGAVARQFDHDIGYQVHAARARAGAIG